MDQGDVALGLLFQKPEAWIRATSPSACSRVV
jgi:hypothetical protein